MPNFFIDHAAAVCFPEANDRVDGLRRPQRGAIFAIGSHFSLSDEASLVSMPTGTGKTAVLMMAPFLLKAQRALVITPSRMVRDQIVEEFEDGYASVFRDFERRVRDELVGGQRHAYEARMKERRRTHGHPDHT